MMQIADELYRNRLSLESESPLTKRTSSGLKPTTTASLSADGEPAEYISLKEVAKHNLSQDAWVIINGKVYE